MSMASVGFSCLSIFRVQLGSSEKRYTGLGSGQPTRFWLASDVSLFQEHATSLIEEYRKAKTRRCVAGKSHLKAREPVCVEGLTPAIWTSAYQSSRTGLAVFEISSHLSLGRCVWICSESNFNFVLPSSLYLSAFSNNIHLQGPSELITHFHQRISDPPILYLALVKGARGATSKSPNLDQLLKSTIDRRADLAAFVKVDGGDGTLGDALRGELEFL